jgi:hypothetical protein
MAEKFIQKAIKRPGALTKRVGGKPSQKPGKVAKLAKKSGLGGQEARFYQDVLKPASKKR